MIGIDWSISSPAMCVEFSDGFDIFYINGDKRACANFEIGEFRVYGIHYSPKDMNHSEIQRFTTLTSIMLPLIPDVEDDVAIFESYSFGSKGRMAQIAENTGILKAGLVSKGYKIEVLAPSTIKKHAAGTGRADKEVMGKAFSERFGFNVHDLLGTKFGHSPSADVIDSFFVLDTWKKLNGHQ